MTRKRLEEDNQSEQLVSILILILSDFPKTG